MYWHVPRKLLFTGKLLLTSGFLYAGASAVLAALWKVDDTATSHFMSHFYQYIKQGLPTGQALQKAQQQMLTESLYHHPYYWAPFALIGTSSLLFPSSLQ